MVEELNEAVAQLDAWCKARIDKLSKRGTDHVLACKSIDDPLYRKWLGEHQAYSAVRSYLHGSIASTRAKDEAND